MPSLRYHELKPLREKRWLGIQGTTERLLRTDGALGLIPAPLQAQRNTASVSKKEKTTTPLLSFATDLSKTFYISDRYSKQS